MAGGTFPAEIWAKFMKVAKGPFCGDFPPPKSSIQWTPFFSKYNGQGRGSSYNYNYDYNYGAPQQNGYNGYTPAPAPAPTPPVDNGTGGEPDDGGGTPGGGPGQ